MGSLHAGHVSLICRAKREQDVVVVSIFVNPAQFGPNEDFRKYPRSLTQDQTLLRRERVDILFHPRRSTVYPKGFRDYVNPGPLSHHLCGPFRPGHFRGVATVLKRLFDMVQPDVSYFGEKDYQQSRIVAWLAKRHRIPVRIKTGEIIRDTDGVALSSRNRYLSPEERISARAIYRSLLKAKQLIRNGVRDPRQVKRAVRTVLLGNVSRIDYITLADPKTLEPLKRVKPPVLVALACYVGSTRLIDNAVVRR